MKHDTRNRNPCRKAKQHPGDAVNSDEVGIAINAAEHTNPEESAIGFEALYNSMYKCKSGVMWKGSVASYFLNGVERTLTLEKQLKDGSYKAAPPTTFTITSPKKREIVSIRFRDRVYQRSLSDNVIYPAMTKGLIRDNCACQKGKGTDNARNRLKCFMQRAYRRNGLNWYVLQCDIKGYYPNMRHDVAKETFRRQLGACIYNRTERVLDEQYAGDIGFNPGSQIIQIAGISVLSSIDHHIKEVLRIKYFLRYMDDFRLIHESEEYLYECKDKIGEKLKEKGFEFNEKKTKVYHISEGILFLGFKFMLTETGKVLMLLNPENVKRERRKLRRLAGLVEKGERTKEKVDECHTSWRAHAKKGNNYKMLQRMDAYYKGLWEGDS